MTISVDMGRKAKKKKKKKHPCPRYNILLYLTYKAARYSVEPLLWRLFDSYIRWPIQYYPEHYLFDDGLSRDDSG